MNTNQAAEEPLGWPEIKPLLAELKQLAQRRLRRTRASSLQTTELLHTALRRMFQRDDVWDDEVIWRNRAHVFGTFLRATERAIIADLRRQGRHKRIGPSNLVPFDELVDSPTRLLEDPALLLDFVRCLELMAQTDVTSATVLQYCALLELDLGEIAELLGISERHARRVLKHAKERFAQFWAAADSSITDEPDD